MIGITFDRVVGGLNDLFAGRKVPRKRNRQRTERRVALDSLASSSSSFVLDKRIVPAVVNLVPGATAAQFAAAWAKVTASPGNVLALGNGTYNVNATLVSPFPEYILGATSGGSASGAPASVLVGANIEFQYEYNANCSTAEVQNVNFENSPNGSLTIATPSSVPPGVVVTGPVVVGQNDWFSSDVNAVSVQATCSLDLESSAFYTAPSSSAYLMFSQDATVQFNGGVVFKNQSVAGFILDDNAYTLISNDLFDFNPLSGGSLVQVTSYTSNLIDYVNGATYQFGYVSINNDSFVVDTAAGIINLADDLNPPASPYQGVVNSQAQDSVTNCNLDDNTITGGTAAAPVGAINVFGTSSAIVNTVFLNESVTYGAALNEVADSARNSLSIEEDIFQCDNNLGGNGGAISLTLPYAAQVFIDSTLLIGCVANNGAGLYVNSTTTGSLMPNITIDYLICLSNEGNSASGVGEGMDFVGQSYVFMALCALENNQAYYYDELGTYTAYSQFDASGGTDITLSGDYISILTPSDYAGANLTFLGTLNVYGTSPTQPDNLTYSVTGALHYSDGVPVFTWIITYAQGY